MKKSQFVVRKNGDIEGIYRDEDAKLYDAIGASQKARFSHIDPIVPAPWWLWTLSALSFFRWRKLRDLQNRSRYRGDFGIYWKGRLAVRWGVTCCDEAGRPFKTKAAAEAFEVAKLQRDHFGTLGQTILVQGSPPLPEDSFEQTDCSVEKGDTDEKGAIGHVVRGRNDDVRTSPS